MNVGIFSDCYLPQINGVITSTQTLKEELEKRGHTVTVITVKTPLAKKSKKDVLRIPSVPFRAFEGFRIGVFYPPKLLVEIRKLKLDIIHTQTEFSVAMLGRMTGKLLGIPVVHTYHTMYEDYVHYIAKTRVNKVIIKKFAKKGSWFYLRSCQAVIVPSHKTAEALRGYGLKKDMDVIPTGIKISNFEEEDEMELQEKLDGIREWFGWNKEDKILLFLGRVAKEKSIDVIIQQLEPLLKKKKNIKLLVVGDGPEKKNLEILVRELKLENQVIFSGWVEHQETKYYYKLSNAFISASVTETQGLTLYEAMAADTVVIAKYDSNLDGVLQDGKNALIFHRNEELKDKVLTLFSENELEEKLLEEGKKTIDFLSAAHFGEKVEAVYQRVIEQKDQEKKRKFRIVRKKVKK